MDDKRAVNNAKSNNIFIKRQNKNSWRQVKLIIIAKISVKISAKISVGIREIFHNVKVKWNDFREGLDNMFKYQEPRYELC